MVWIKNCQDDDWINLDNVFSISFQQIDAAGKDDWIEFIVRPSNARILQICLEVGTNPNPDPNSDDISWHSLFYDRAMKVATAVFEAISKAQNENRIRIDLQKEISMEFG
jgi:hypothetical protein